MMDELFTDTLKWDATTRMAIEVFIVVFIALLADFVQKRVVKRLELKAAGTKHLWDDAVLYAVKLPLSVLIWVLGLTFAAQVVAEHTDASIFSLVHPVRDVGVIATITWFLYRAVTAIENNIYLSRQDLDRTTVDALSKLVRASVVITGSLVMLQTLGFSISGVLAFGGIGGLAVGFAAKDMLANFFGGFMLYLDRPFSVGDWIRSPDRDIEGVVEHIGWRLTTIRTFDKRPLYLPNSTFTTISVVNPSRMTHRRIYETIGIRYDDALKMAPIVEEVKQMLIDHEEIDSNQTLIVNFNAFAPSSLDFFIYTFTKTTAWVHFHEVKQDVLLKVIAIIDKHGAEIAYPTSTVHVPEPLQLNREFHGPEG